MNGDAVEIEWDVTRCLPSSDYDVLSGVIGAFRTVTETACAVGASGRLTLPLPGPARWWLVVGTDGQRGPAALATFGRDAFGVERPLVGWESRCAAAVQDTSLGCP